MTLSNLPDPPSPCVKICVLDSAGRICLGCQRTLEEIASWSRLSGDAKRRIIARIAAAGGGTAS